MRVSQDVPAPSLPYFPGKHGTDWCLCHPLLHADVNYGSEAVAAAAQQLPLDDVSPGAALCSPAQPSRA